MANHLGVPGITVQQFAAKVASGDVLILMDIREEHELASANLGGTAVFVPLSQIAKRYEEAMPEELREDKNQEIIVMCHHGIRSAQVTAWLADSGYSNVWNLDGGIEAYATEVDTAVGRY